MATRILSMRVTEGRVLALLRYGKRGLTLLFKN